MTYDSWEDATDIVAIEKLLFTHFDEDFDDGTSLDLAVLEIQDSQNENAENGLTEEENRLFYRVSIAQASFLIVQNWRVDFHFYVEQINLESEEHQNENI